MTGLTTAELARACRIFLTLAYPEGEATIPEKRRAYFCEAAETPAESPGDIGYSRAGTRRRGGIGLRRGAPSLAYVEQS